MPVHLIAEAGTTHEGDPERALAAVDAAAAAGADSVKFQIIHPGGLYAEELVDADGRRPNPAIAARTKQLLPEGTWARLAERAAARGIAFSASVFDVAGLDILDRIGVPYVKIASCDLDNVRFLRRVAERGRRTILSTGMCGPDDLAEIERAVAIFEAEGTDLVLLHCVSAYPATLGEMRLGMIPRLRSAFGLPVGLSDHTESSLAAAMAVALGVSWIEKHCTHDRAADGFDHAYAMEPDMLARYFADVREAERARRERSSDEATGLSPFEVELRPRARRGVYLRHAIAAGARVTAADVAVVRPASALRPSELEDVLGMVAVRDLAPWQPLRREDLV